MKSFRDQNGKLWEVAIRVAELKRLRNMLNINLADLVLDELKPLGALLSDHVKLVDVLYVICESQCKDAGVSDVQFGESLAGASLHDATLAFLEALSDFFPDPATRTLMQKIVAAAVAVNNRRAELASQISSADIATFVAQSLPSASASSESTPTASPSVS